MNIKKRSFLPSILNFFSVAYSFSLENSFPFQRLGHFDPLSRKEMTENQLVPNLALKEVINNFLTENPWAEEY